MGEDGTCKECEDNDVSDRCLPGQSYPSETQQSCVSQKCMDGWIGDHCDMVTSDTNPTLPPTDVMPTPKPTNLVTPAPTNWAYASRLHPVRRQGDRLADEEGLQLRHGH